MVETVVEFPRTRGDQGVGEDEVEDDEVWGVGVGMEGHGVLSSSS